MLRYGPTQRRKKGNCAVHQLNINEPSPVELLLHNPSDNTPLFILKQQAGAVKRSRGIGQSLAWAPIPALCGLLFLRDVGSL